ncbi:glycoside hydrolase family 55 protein [Sporolactobacillus shoreicorticis]|uniref:Glycosyl hydrolase family 28-related protein n=1 Tax=Sporolactobacillus shoreicorticis TaxID=1923877 RepID=A0ABW5S2Y1_9BACL|nr:glycosyl hydrolase family 28-related protein [Sporolactobacillus shoreicorticis]MCO7124216.1 glycoside hydrolase family 55 protein [Sporolactobacillus shoreicorticis]
MNHWMFKTSTKLMIAAVVLLVLGGCSLNTAPDPTIVKKSSEEQSITATNNPALLQAKAFQVKGDGKTDNTEAVEKLFRAAAEVKGTVYFGKGVYLISKTISVPKNVSIIGAGMRQTTFKSMTDKDEAVFSLAGEQTLQDVGFKSRIGVLPAGDNITINNAAFSCRVQGIQNSVTVRNLIITNSLFERSGYAILSNSEPSYDVKILNCRFVNNTADAIEINAPSQRWTIENCTFRGIKSKTSNAGFGVGAAISAKAIVVKGCTFENINGQAVHAEAHSEVAVINCTFKNSGHSSYAGSPHADIAVLSEATVTVAHSVFLKSDPDYSKLAIYNTDRPVGGTVVVSDSVFYKKKIDAQVKSVHNQFHN